MAYNDPQVSSLQDIRFELQRNILALEQKLRHRRQNNIGGQYLYHGQLEPRKEQYLYDFPPYSYAPPSYIENRELAERVRHALDEQEKGYVYGERIYRLEREHDLLNQQKQAKEFGIQYGYPNLVYGDDDYLLIQKYQDGTRAQEIRSQLDQYSHYHPSLMQRPHPNPPHFHCEKSQYSSAQKQNHPPSHQYEEERSPYSKINFETTNHKRIQKPNSKDIFSANSPEKQANKRGILKKDASHKNWDNIENNHKDYEHQQLSQQETGVGKKSKMPTFHQRLTSKSLKSFHNKNHNISFSMYNPHNNEIVGKSKGTSRKKSPLKISTLNRSRSIYANLTTEESASLKIRNRLKLSQITFQDSKFRNIKHETNHLHMTFENELKQRRDIKDKINSNPIVMKRHAMVIQ